MLRNLLPRRDRMKRNSLSSLLSRLKEKVSQKYLMNQLLAAFRWRIMKARYPFLVGVGLGIGNDRNPALYGNYVAIKIHIYKVRVETLTMRISFPSRVSVIHALRSSEEDSLNEIVPGASLNRKVTSNR